MLYPKLLFRLPWARWFLDGSSCSQQCPGWFERCVPRDVLHSHFTEVQGVLSPARRLRDLPGVFVKDVPRYLRALSRSGAGIAVIRLAGFPCVPR